MPIRWHIARPRRSPTEQVNGERAEEDGCGLVASDLLDEDAGKRMVPLPDSR
ncbi:MAG: hypothetical protein WAM70_13430 [Pyrinomonadaceae bacterium]